MTHTNTFSSPFNNSFTEGVVFTQPLDVALLLSQLMLERLDPLCSGLKLRMHGRNFRMFLLHNSPPNSPADCVRFSPAISVVQQLIRQQHV